jgi:ribonuclease BN (tRNA processing enzyme)
VISGDTRPSATIEEISRGADVLVHEVYYARGLREGRREAWRAYHQAHHTSTHELGRIAAAARPKLLVLYHILSWGASKQDLLDEIAEEYDGRAIVGQDLGIY